jgi:hypothetical protein
MMVFEPGLVVQRAGGLVAVFDLQVEAWYAAFYRQGGERSDDHSGEPARSLYHQAGFEDHHGYHYRIAPCLPE